MEGPINRWTLAPPPQRWPAIHHQHVQPLLSAGVIAPVLGLQHLAIVTDHLAHLDRIVATVFRPIKVDAAAAHAAVGGVLEPRTSGQILASGRVYPDLAAARVAGDVRAVPMPVLDVFGRCGQAAVAGGFAAPAAAVTGFHRVSLHAPGC